MNKGEERIFSYIFYSKLKVVGKCSENTTGTKITFWPDEQIFLTTLGQMRAVVRARKITRTALVFVGRALAETDFIDSKLYDEAYAHVLRNKGKKRQREVS